MESGSVLFDRPDHQGEPREPPACFADLRLDRVVTAVTAGRQQYDLAPLFHAPLRDTAAVSFRHEVFRDLEDGDMYEAVTGFAGRMRRMRQLLRAGEQARSRYRLERYVLDAVAAYCQAVTSLHDGLAEAELGSRGLRWFRGYLTGYVNSAGFRSLSADTRTLLAELAEVRYTVHVRDNQVTVARYRDEADYGALVEATFARFGQRHPRPVGENRWAGPEASAGVGRVEAQILERVAWLYPDTFHTLAAYPAGHEGFLDQTIHRFDRQVQFYLAWLDYLRRFRRLGLPVCYPQVSTSSKQTQVEAGYDLALADSLAPDRPVGNDLRLAGAERVMVDTGPNQGGKTTFARMVGQLHYLAALGCPVPAARARLFLPDQVFTHFEREEHLATLRGKLDDELVRIRDILTRATGESLIVMNESFTSTTLQDARYIGTRILRQVIGLGALAVFVTFVDELASLDAGTVSLVAAVDPAEPDRRTYQVVRRPADGRAYAATLAAAHGLTYQAVRERMGR